MCVSSEANEVLSANLLQVASEQHNMLFGYAASLTKDDDSAHDLLQDSILKCHQRILKKGFQGSYMAYLVGAIKLNYFCQRRSIPKRLVLADELKDVSEEADDTALRNELADTISAHMANHYPADQVAVFDLHVAGQTYNEISFLTKFTYWQVHYLIQKMKRELKETFRNV